MIDALRVVVDSLVPTAHASHGWMDGTHTQYIAALVACMIGFVCVQRCADLQAVIEGSHVRDKQVRPAQQRVWGGGDQQQEIPVWRLARSCSKVTR